MPSIDRLQKKYSKEAAIFTITHNSEAEISNLWANSPGIKVKNIPLPGTMTDDSIMRRYFPNSFVPYLVWIDPQRKVRRSEEHTSELQSLMRISYAVFCLKTN